MRPRWICILLLVAGVYQSGLSQEVDTLKVVKLVLTDGSELVGKIVEEQEDRYIFLTLSGIRVEVQKTAVKEKEELRGEAVGTEYKRVDPNRTRLFFAPTARALPQGKGYFSAYEIFFPFLAVGVTDYLTLSGGMSLVPGVSEQLLYFAPKIRFAHLENFDLAGGVLYAGVPSAGSFGIAYGVATFGSERAALTVGLGYGFADGDFADSPVIVLGGEVQLSNSLKLLTENWLPPESDVLVYSFGLRFFGESLAADFGFIGVTESTEGWPFFPWLGFAYNF